MTIVSQNIEVEWLEPLDQRVTDLGLTVEQSYSYNNTTSVQVVETLDAGQIASIENLINTQNFHNSVTTKKLELADKLEEVKSNNIEILGYDFQYHELDISTLPFRDMNADALAALFTETYSTSIKSSDGYEFASSRIEILRVHALVVHHFKVNNSNYNLLLDQIDAASDIPEVDAVDLSVGWTFVYDEWVDVDNNLGVQGGNGHEHCIPFYLTDGSPDHILVVGGEIPFYITNGSQNNIPLTTC